MSIEPTITGEWHPSTTKRVNCLSLSCHRSDDGLPQHDSPAAGLPRARADGGQLHGHPENHPRRFQEEPGPGFVCLTIQGDVVANYGVCSQNRPDYCPSAPGCLIRSVTQTAPFRLLDVFFFIIGTMPTVFKTAFHGLLLVSN